MNYSFCWCIKIFFYLNFYFLQLCAKTPPNILPLEPGTFKWILVFLSRATPLYPRRPISSWCSHVTGMLIGCYWSPKSQLKSSWKKYPVSLCLSFTGALFLPSPNAFSCLIIFPQLVLPHALFLTLSQWKCWISIGTPTLQPHILGFWEYERHLARELMTKQPSITDKRGEKKLQTPTFWSVFLHIWQCELEDISFPQIE